METLTEYIEKGLAQLPQWLQDLDRNKWNTLAFNTGASIKLAITRGLPGAEGYRNKYNALMEQAETRLRVCAGDDEIDQFFTPRIRT